MTVLLILIAGAIVALVLDFLMSDTPSFIERLDKQYQDKQYQKSPFF